MKVVTEILQDLEILKRLLKHNANYKIRINYYLTVSFTDCQVDAMTFWYFITCRKFKTFQKENS